MPEMHFANHLIGNCKALDDTQDNNVDLYSTVETPIVTISNDIVNLMTNLVYIIYRLISTILLCIIVYSFIVKTINKLSTIH